MKLQLVIGVALFCGVSAADAAPRPLVSGLNALVKPLDAALAPLDPLFAPITANLILSVSNLGNPVVQKLTAITAPTIGKYDAALVPALIGATAALPGLSRLGL